MAVDSKALAKKRAVYDDIMKSKETGARGGIDVCRADPIDYSLGEAVQQIQIMERLAKSWKMRFCQGVLKANSSAWFAYGDAGMLRAVVHVERFQVKMDGIDGLTFWYEAIHSGRELARSLGLPFVVVVSLGDGLFSCKLVGTGVDLTAVEDGSRVYAGGRPDKGEAYPGDHVGAVMFISEKLFTKIGPAEA